METQKNKKYDLLILGGGFGGLYAALELERANNSAVRVTLVSKENFFLFTPMLHEVAASDLGPAEIVNSIRKLLKRTRFVCGEVESVDIEQRQVVVSHGSGIDAHELSFDFLILALGSVNNFYNLPGVEQGALTIKSLGDALFLRNQAIASLEQEDFERSLGGGKKRIVYVVAGGGFAGVETAAALNDFLREAIQFYQYLDRDDLEVVLVHAEGTLLPELDEKLGQYAHRKLEQKGIRVLTNTSVTGYRERTVLLGDNAIPDATLVWAGGIGANPVISALKCIKDRGRVVVDDCLRLAGSEHIFAVGDCAVVRDPATQKPAPPTAQHALREGRLAARNVLAAIERRPLKPFRYKMLGQLASLGRHTAVANIFGWRFSGFFAWWLWRTIYLIKLPRLEKKIRVALSWTLDVAFSRELVQILTLRAAEIEARGFTFDGNAAENAAPAEKRVA